MSRFLRGPRPVGVTTANWVDCEEFLTGQTHATRLLDTAA